MINGSLFVYSTSYFINSDKKCTKNKVQIFAGIQRRINYFMTRGVVPHSIPLIH
ncbi:MAG: hypothetical protein ACI8RP_001616, partial [Urechidicola sp.]